MTVTRAWELLALIVIFGVVLRMIIDFLAPLVPYIAIAALMLGSGYVVAARRRNW